MWMTMPLIYGHIVFLTFYCIAGEAVLQYPYDQKGIIMSTLNCAAVNIRKLEIALVTTRDCVGVARSVNF